MPFTIQSGTTFGDGYGFQRLVGSQYIDGPPEEGQLQAGENTSTLDSGRMGLFGGIEAGLTDEPAQSQVHHIAVPILEQSGRTCAFCRGMPVWICNRKTINDNGPIEELEARKKVYVDRLGTNFRAPYMDAASLQRADERCARCRDAIDRKIAELRIRNDREDDLRRLVTGSPTGVDAIEFALAQRGWKFRSGDRGPIAFSAPQLVKAFYDLASFDLDAARAAAGGGGGGGGGDGSGGSYVGRDGRSGTRPDEVRSPAPAPAPLDPVVVSGRDQGGAPPSQEQILSAVHGNAAASIGMDASDYDESVGEEPAPAAAPAALRRGSLVDVLRERVAFSGIVLATGIDLMAVAHFGDAHMHDYFRYFDYTATSTWASAVPCLPRNGDDVGFWLKPVDVQPATSPATGAGIPHPSAVLVTMRTYALLPVVRRRGTTVFGAPWNENNARDTTVRVDEPEGGRGLKRNRAPATETVPTGDKVFVVGTIKLTKVVYSAPNMRSMSPIIPTIANPFVLLPVPRHVGDAMENACMMAHFEATQKSASVHLCVRPCTVQKLPPPVDSEYIASVRNGSGETSKTAITDLANSCARLIDRANEAVQTAGKARVYPGMTDGLPVQFKENLGRFQDLVARATDKRYRVDAEDLERLTTLHRYFAAALKKPV